MKDPVFPTKLAQALRPDDIGNLISFKVGKAVETNGVQVGVAGKGSGKLLGYFLMDDDQGGYVSLAIEGYAHHIAVGGEDEVTIHHV